MSPESQILVILSKTLNPTSSFSKQNLMPVLPQMNVQMPLQNTKPAMETASQLKQAFAPQALVAIPSSLISAGELLKKLLSKTLALKLPNTALD